MIPEHQSISNFETAPQTAEAGVSRDGSYLDFRSPFNLTRETFTHSKINVQDNSSLDITFDAALSHRANISSLK